MKFSIMKNTFTILCVVSALSATASLASAQMMGNTLRFRLDADDADDVPPSLLSI